MVSAFAIAIMPKTCTVHSQIWVSNWREGYFHYFLQILLAINSISFSSKQKGYKCKDFNANSAIPCLNIIQHPSSLSILQSLQASFSGTILESLCWAVQGPSTWMVSSSYWGKGKIIPHLPINAPPPAFAHVQTNLRHCPKHSSGILASLCSRG